MLVEGLALALVALAIWLWFSDDENPLDKLPGPPKTPVLGNVLQLLKVKPDGVLSLMVNSTEEYGDRYVFKVLKERVLHTSRPSDLEVLLTHSKNIKKSKPYQFLEDWLGSGLLLSTGGHWHKRRKILTPTFHFNILKNFATVFEEKSLALVEFLKKEKGEAIDLVPLISDFTLYTICETAMGTKLDEDLSSSTREYKNSLVNIGFMMLYRITRVWLHNNLVFRLSPSGRKFIKELTVAKAFAENVITDRKASRKISSTTDAETSDGLGTKKRLAMLDLLLEAEEKGEIDIAGIRDEVNTFMFEGHDTTATAITFCLMLLADHEEIQERVFEECQAIVGDADHAPTPSELAEMKYLEAVIKETLRLYPSVPYIGRTIVEDFVMGDILVKAGTTVEIHIYELHRRADMFPNPEVFDPDRFLTGEMKHPYAFTPFSAGPRNCIGQRFAMQEMKCTLSEIVRNFKLVPKVKGARPALIADLVLRPAEPIFIKFMPR